MIDASILNMDHLMQIYGVANTPAYLFHRLRGEWDVQDFSKKNSTQDIVDFIFEVDSMVERSMRNVVLAYVAIVGLTFKNYTEVQQMLNGKTFSALEWAGEILNLWKTTYVPTMNISIGDFPPTIVISERRTSASTNIITLND